MGEGLKASTGPKTLETPKSFDYDEENYTLTWEAVENAESYTVEYNGEAIEVEQGETSLPLILSAMENSFKIKANEDTVNYLDSAWSEAIVYNIASEEELSLFDKINIELVRAAKKEGYTLKRIIGISFIDLEGVYITGNFHIDTLCEKNDKQYNVEYGYAIKNKNNIRELLNEINENTYSGSIPKKHMPYNSAEKLVAYGRYGIDGEMARLKEQGYEITVIDSCVREGSGTSKFRFEIVGTYKAGLGEDVKYFTSLMQVDVLNPGTDTYNYETALGFKEKVTVEEKQFILHEEGGTLEYMAKLIEQKE